MNKVNAQKIQIAPRSLWFFVLFLSLAVYFPLLWMVKASFFTVDSSGESQLTFQWYLRLFEDQSVWDSLQRSFWVAIFSSTLSTFLGTLAALALARSRTWRERFTESLVYVSLVLPEIVFAISILCLFFLLKVPLSLTTVVVAHSVFSFSFVVLTVTGRWTLFESHWLEAAQDLGASEIQILFKIILPFLSPALASGWVLSFLISFDDFLIAFFVNGVGSDTWPVKLYSSMKLGLTPQLNALASLLLLFSFFLMIVFTLLKSRERKGAALER